jgi:hypothetical protein
MKLVTKSPVQIIINQETSKFFMLANKVRVSPQPFCLPVIKHRTITVIGRA